MKATGRKVRGRGAAQAVITSRLTPSEGGTKVSIATELQLSGAVVQYGRGMIQDVSDQLVGLFAECLRTQLAGSAPDAEAAVTKARQGIPLLTLAAGALRKGVTRPLTRLLKRSETYH